MTPINVAASAVILLVEFTKLSGATSGNKLFYGFVFPSQSYKLAVFNCCCQCHVISPALSLVEY